MRRQVLSKEHSLCIFCTHKFHGMRPRLSRRLLHSSRVLAKPPGATAPKNNGYGETQSLVGSGSTGQGHSPFGSRPTIASSPNNAETSIDDELTEDEQRVRDLMKQRYLKANPLIGKSATVTTKSSLVEESRERESNTPKPVRREHLGKPSIEKPLVRSHLSESPLIRTFESGARSRLDEESREGERSITTPVRMRHLDEPLIATPLVGRSPSVAKSSLDDDLTEEERRVRDLMKKRNLEEPSIAKPSIGSSPSAKLSLDHGLTQEERRTGDLMTKKHLEKPSVTKPLVESSPSIAKSNLDDELTEEERRVRDLMKKRNLEEPSIAKPLIGSSPSIAKSNLDKESAEEIRRKDLMSKRQFAPVAKEPPVVKTSPQGSPNIVESSIDDDMTEEELRIRDLMKKRNLDERQRTLVDVHGGPGPESSRAGRYDLPRQTAEERLRYDEKNARIQEARMRHEEAKVRREAPMSEEEEGKGHANGTPKFSIRSPGTRVEYLGSASQTRTNSDNPTKITYDQAPNWEHLRKQQHESHVQPQNTQKVEDDEMSAFAKARAEREAQASSRAYVPLTRRSPFPPSTGDRFPNHSERVVFRDGEQAQTRPSLHAELKPRFSRGPFGLRTATIRPGEWRDEPVQRDDRLRRIVRDDAGSRNGTFGNRTGSGNESTSDYTNHEARRHEGGSSNHLGHAPKNSSRGYETPGTEAANKTFDGYEIPGPKTSKDTLDGYDIPGPKTSKNTLDGYEIFKKEISEESQGSRSRYSPGIEAIPKGKERDKAKRRQQFVSSYDEVKEDEEAAARAEQKKQRRAERAAKKAAALTPIFLPEWISVSNLATALKVRLEAFTRKLEDLGYVDIKHDFVLGAEDAGLIAQEYGFEPIIDRGDSEDLKGRPPAEDVSVLPPRPPVVTIMGHVDHGKTTLLDWLRKSSVVASEHGGITQHIGAFSVPMPSGKIITFLDTPGHEAFLSMRQRGASVTDIVILVVAADDSVMPQTIEAIKHAKSAKVPIIVAVNKIDKPDANAERAKHDLARHGVEVEDIGGDTQAVCVSGLTGQGMGDLEEAVVTLSEILDMRAEIDGQAEGWVIEASLKSMGKVATILVKRGTMRVGDFIVAGKTWARIRCMRNEAGIEIEEAGPGTPVEIDGWREQPLAGDEVLQAPDERIAKQAVDFRLEKEEREKMAEDMEAINEVRKAEQEKREREKREAAIAAGKSGVKELEEEVETESSAPKTKYINFIVKADVSGSVEAVVDSLSALGNNEIRTRILRFGVGQLTEFDVDHAAAAKGHLINFNTEVDPNISMRAFRAGVKILDHNVIYKLVDDVRTALNDELPPIISYSVTGEAEISKVFDITVKGRKTKPIAGCKVRLGVIKRSSKVKVLRQGEKIFDGTLATLKNVKKNVLEMRLGNECGIEFQGWSGFQEGDLIQCYDEIVQKRYL